MILEELRVDLLCEGRCPCSFSMTQKKNKETQKVTWWCVICFMGSFSIAIVYSAWPQWVNWTGLTSGEADNFHSSGTSVIQHSLANAHQGNHIRCGTWIFIFIFFWSACCASKISLIEDFGHLHIFMGLTQVFYYLELLLVKQINQLSGKDIDVGWHI